MSQRCYSGPYRLALVIGLLASSAQAQPDTPVARPFAPLAQLMDDVNDGFKTAKSLKHEIATAEKKLKNDRKTYLADRDRVTKLQADVETARRMVTGADRKWLCNRYHSLHDDPSQCSEPGFGGVWVIIDADGRTRRWTEPTQKEIDAAARAALKLEMLEAKLAQAKERLDRTEGTLRSDTDKYNRLVDDLTGKTARLADPKRVLDDIAREAARNGDEATIRKINGLDKLLGKVTGTGQCAVLVQAYVNVGKADTWKPDGTVGKDGPLVPFAPIATFVGDDYPNKPKGNHAAILLERTADGLLVFDQHTGKTGGIRVIHYKGGTAAHQADIARGEAEAAEQGLTEDDGLAYYKLKYKYYSPSNDADNYSYIKRPGTSP
jgi:hypothetical protein